MKKFLDHPDQLLPDSLAGFCAAHADLVALGDGAAFIRRSSPRHGKVALISGGGSGHEPLHAGFVGLGMLDAACPGQVFTSPTPDQMLQAAAAVDGGAGVLYIVKNYEGDVMNFDMAAEMASTPVARVLTDDDVAVERSTWSTGRRGVAGTMVVEKIVGAAAEAGMPLEACKALGDEVNRATRSIGVALSSCTVPAAGKPTFDIGITEMEFGVGIHGEPGRKRVALGSAQQIAQDMAEAVLADLGHGQAADRPALLLVNGFGGTPLMELYLMYHHLRERFAAAKLHIVRSLVGNYVTSLDMAGCSATITLLQGDLMKWWDAPVHTPALRWGV